MLRLSGFSGSALGLALALAGAPRAHANITYYDTFKVQYFSQISTSQPVTTTGFGGFANVNASLASDLSGGTVTSSSPLSPMTLTGSGGNYSFGIFPATKVLLDADFPNGTTYTFHLTGGTYNGQSAAVATPATDDYSATVPYFTGSTYTTLQNFNVANLLNLTFNSYATPAGVNTPLTYIEIDKVSDSSAVYSTNGTNTLTSASVGANTLAPATQYDLSIVYSARLLTTNAGFGTATSFAAYDLRTDLFFTTAALTATPEPASFGIAGLGIFGLLLAVRRKRTA